jgi:hypothetical protein
MHTVVFLCFKIVFMIIFIFYYILYYILFIFTAHTISGIIDNSYHQGGYNTHDPKLVHDILT